MKLSVTIVYITFWATTLLEGVWATQSVLAKHESALATSVQGTVFEGRPSQPSPITNEPDDDSTPPPPIPTGQPTGPINPSSPETNITVSGGNLNTTTMSSQACRGNNVAFGENTIFGKGGTNPSDPSGARAGKVVFSTANNFAAISLDGGATFNTINPTVYAGPPSPASATDGGFCCNLVVHYLPSVRHFVWLLQYKANARAVNKLRIITFRPSDVSSTAILSYRFLDIVSNTNLGLRGDLRYSDLAVGNDFLYISATNTGVGLVVIRVPIIPLVFALGPLTYSYTNPAHGAVAYHSHISQNAGDTVF